MEHSGSMWLEFIAAIIVPVALFVAATAIVHTVTAAALPGDELLNRLLTLAVYLLVYAALFLALMKAHRWLLANRPLGFYISEVWTEFYLGLVPPPCWWGSPWDRSCSVGRPRPRARPAARSARC